MDSGNGRSDTDLIGDLLPASPPLPDDDREEPPAKQAKTREPWSTRKKPSWTPVVLLAVAVVLTVAVSAYFLEARLG